MPNATLRLVEGCISIEMVNFNNNFLGYTDMRGKFDFAMATSNDVSSI